VGQEFASKLSLHATFICSPDSIYLSDLEAIYPEFANIYQKLLRDARLDSELRRNGDFQAWKLRLVSVRYLLGKHRHLRPERRADLIQSLLEDDFNHVLWLLQDDEISPVFGLVVAAVGAFLYFLFRSIDVRWGGAAFLCALAYLATQMASPKARVREPVRPGGVELEPDALLSPVIAESLKREMKVLAAQLSDSQFLLELKGVDNKELLPTIQDIETLVHSLHSSLIDKTVGALTHTVVAMQQEHRKRAIQDELKNEEMKLRNEVLVGFIRGLNVQLARRQDS